MTPTKGKPVVVLLVEDNMAHAELVIRSLEDHGVVNQIIHLQDGESALAYMRRQGIYANPEASPRPDVILLDLRLPRVDGLEVLKEIKADPALASIPIVMLTTSHAEEDITRAYSHHVNSYLVKPIDFESFRELIKNLGFYWLIWNERLDGSHDDSDRGG